jgi:mannitol-specific phosphotransferase system IIBC component
MNIVQLCVAVAWLMLAAVFIRRGWTGNRAWAVTIGKAQVEKAPAKIRATNIGFGIFFLILGLAQLLMVSLKTAYLR